MPDMLKRFWQRSERAKIASLEREVLSATKSLRKAELNYFADGLNKEKCDAWVDAQSEYERVIDQLIEMEEQNGM